MKIISMTATFGKLDHAHLELEDGLNLISAPNEGGKSTWCAFWKAMLYGIDTRDRDRAGHLADKNRYQPWWGAPMEGEVVLEWQGRRITLRRGPRGSVPFGSFSAVYSDTGEPVPGLTAATCGEQLAGAGKAVFERSAFLGADGNLSVTSAPELEKRIAALVSSGEEDVSFSQTEARLRDWLNRRRVNKSVGLIPKLEEEARRLDDAAQAQAALAERITALEARQADLQRRRDALQAQQKLHRQLARQDLDRRYAQASRELEDARQQLDALEQDRLRAGPSPDKEQLKKAQGELQYLKVLDEEIKAAEEALAQADEAYVQAQIAAQDDHFSGLSGEEAAALTDRQLRAAEQSRRRAAAWRRRGWTLFALAAVLILGVQIALHASGVGRPAAPWFHLGLPALGVGLFVLGVGCLLRGKKEQGSSGSVLAHYQVENQEELNALVRDYARRCQAAAEAAQNAKAARGHLNDRKARREKSWGDILNFVHTFAPEVQNVFGCSAALSRALNLDHERAVARDRVEERRRRFDDLAAQGGALPQEVTLPAPTVSAQEAAQGLAAAEAALEQTAQALNQALGQQKAMGDPAELAAAQERCRQALDRRTEEYDALTIALAALKEANLRLQERFSPALNQLAGQYLARLTGQRYASITLTRTFQGAAATAADVRPHPVLALSRGTADQIYLAVRLAVCALCLPEKPPILLDDALAAFDDDRLRLALDLLRELAGEQQLLLFTCQSREADALAGAADVTFRALPGCNSGTNPL